MRPESYAKIFVDNYPNAYAELNRVTFLLKEFKTFFYAPNISIELKLSLLNSELTPFLKEILKEKFDDFNSLQKFIKIIEAERKNIKLLEVEIANKNLESKLKEILEKKYDKIEIIFKLNKDLIAGFKIKEGSKVLDLSLAAELKGISEWIVTK